MGDWGCNVCSSDLVAQPVSNQMISNLTVHKLMLPASVCDEFNMLGWVRPAYLHASVCDEFNRWWVGGGGFTTGLQPNDLKPNGQQLTTPPIRPRRFQHAKVGMPRVPSRLSLRYIQTILGGLPLSHNQLPTEFFPT